MCAPCACPPCPPPSIAAVVPGLDCCPSTAAPTPSTLQSPCQLPCPTPNTTSPTTKRCSRRASRPCAMLAYHRAPPPPPKTAGPVPTTAPYACLHRLLPRYHQKLQPPCQTTSTYNHRRPPLPKDATTVPPTRAYLVCLPGTPTKCRADANHLGLQCRLMLGACHPHGMTHAIARPVPTTYTYMYTQAPCRLQCEQMYPDVRASATTRRVKRLSRLNLGRVGVWVRIYIRLCSRRSRGSPLPV